MFLDHARFARLGDDQVEFLGGDMLLRFALQAHQAEQRAARRIEQPHDRGSTPGERHQRPRHCRCDRLGRAQRDLLGDKLADHQRQIGGDADHDRKAKRLGRFGAKAEKFHPRRDRPAQARARIRTRQNPDQGDADLGGRQEFAGVGGERHRRARAALASARHRLQPCFPRRNNRQFGHGENAVQHDQREDDRDVDPREGGKRVHNTVRFLRAIRANSQPSLYFRMLLGCGPQRRVAKKLRSKAAASPSPKPGNTSGRWWIVGWLNSIGPCSTAPPLGSLAP